jgi:hypothetical protein
MRCALMALVAVAACTLSPAPARAANYPYCIKGCDYGSGLGDCSFATYQQCQATASGRLAYCAANPYFNQSADRPAGKLSHRRY